MRENTVSSMPHLCPDCDSSDTRVCVVEREVQADSGASFTYVDELTECLTCGEQFYTFEQSVRHSIARSDAIRSANRYLSPTQIRQVRLRLRMKQEEFERALGVGRKTVVRWERGTVTPSSAANGLLWIADRYPAAFLEYASAYSDLRRPLSGALDAPVAYVADYVIGQSSSTVAVETSGDPLVINEGFSLEAGSFFQPAESEALLEAVA